MSSVPVPRDEARFAVPSLVAEKISRVVKKTRELRLISGGMLAAAGGLAVLLGAILVDWNLVLFESAQRQSLTTVALFAIVALALVAVGTMWFRQITTREAASQIDRQIPELQERWQSVVEFAAMKSAPELRGSESLRNKVAEEAARLGSRVEPQKIRFGRELQIAGIGLGCALALWLVALLIDAGHVTVLVRRFFSPSSPISLTQIQSEPGDAVLPRGSNIKLAAVISGRLRRSAELTVQRAEEAPEVFALELAPAESPRFEFPIKNLQEPFAYRFRSGDGQTPWHQVTVAESPKFNSLKLRIIPPAYSGLAEAQFESLPKVAQALAGSRLELLAEPNRLLKSMNIQLEKGPSIALSVDDSRQYRWETSLTESLVFRPIMESPEGLQNESPPRCEIVVYRDQPPAVSIAAPTVDVAVQPDDQVTIAFDARDDLGISRAELVIYDGSAAEGQELKTIPIPLGDQAGERTLHAQVELDLEEFALKHGEELQYAIRVYDTKQEMATQAPQDQATASRDGKSESEQKNGEQPKGTEKGSDQPSKDSPAESQASSPSKQTSDTESQSQEKQTAKNADRKDDVQDNPEKTADREQEEAAKKQAGGGNTWTPDSAGKTPPEKKSPSGETASAPRPEFNMAKHQLDTPPGQCTSCSPRRITIDEWAGSYASQVLDKLQLEIDPVLKQLKKVLIEAQTALSPVADRVKKQAGWENADSVSVRTADGHLHEADQHVKDLTSKSDDTPYAFIGLQLQDITQLHILPARRHLSEVTLFDGSANAEDLTASLVHIQRSLELLEKLTQQYEAVKINQKLSDAMTQIKKMHQIFLEGTFAMLTSQKPTLNPKQRAFMELELSDEYLKKLQELLQKKLDIQAELAKVLSQDPRLLQRFMARSRLEATTLRDQLTLLNQRQQQLLQDVKDDQAADGKPDQESQQKRRLAQRIASADQVAQQAAQMLDNYVVWMPRDLDIEHGALAKFKAKGVALVATATELAKEARQEKPEAARDAAQQLYEQLGDLRETLPDLLDEEEHPQLPTHVANRVEELDTLITDLSGWIRKQEVLAAGRTHLAAEVDQHRITVDVETLTRKLASLRAQCQGISPELGEKAEEFLSTMDRELVPELELSQIALSGNVMPEAIKHQTASIDSFHQAEKELDAIMDGIIEHLDSLPFDKNPQISDDAVPPSLDELLAMLENEARAAEGLGIPCCRPSNLVVEKDWSMPGSSAGSGSGSGSGQSGQGARQGSGNRRSLQPHAQMNQAKQARDMADKIRRESDAALKKMMQSPESGPLKSVARRPERAWDSLGSQLEHHLRNGRGNQAPEQYRQAIERYFEKLAGKQAKPADNP